MRKANYFPQPRLNWQQALGFWSSIAEYARHQIVVLERKIFTLPESPTLRPCPVRRYSYHEGTTSQ